jgi:hypothetical protein
MAEAAGATMSATTSIAVAAIRALLTLLPSFG